MLQKAYVNLGCGKIILPKPIPVRALVDPTVFAYPDWLNVDRNAGDGVDQVVDLFKYPWPFEDCSFDGALLSHIVEHIPHEIKIIGDYIEYDEQGFQKLKPDFTGEQHLLRAKLRNLQDGWLAFFAELHRVLTPGAIAHILCPYAWSQGYATDYTHIRPITEQVWTHDGMGDNFASPFAYKSGCNFRMVEPCKLSVCSLFHHLLADTKEPYIQSGRHNWTERIVRAMQTQINVIDELYVKLEAVK